MSIREAVARAIYETWWQEIEGFKGDPYYRLSANLWENWLPAADSTITAFLEAAAEQGWHMRPDDATEEMINTRIVSEEIAYRAMNAAAPKFEWDK